MTQEIRINGVKWLGQQVMESVQQGIHTCGWPWCSQLPRDRTTDHGLLQSPLLLALVLRHCEAANLLAQQHKTATAAAAGAASTARQGSCYSVLHSQSDLAVLAIVVVPSVVNVDVHGR